MSHLIFSLILYLFETLSSCVPLKISIAQEMQSERLLNDTSPTIMESVIEFPAFFRVPMRNHGILSFWFKGNECGGGWNLDENFIWKFHVLQATCFVLTFKGYFMHLFSWKIFWCDDSLQCLNIYTSFFITISILAEEEVNIFILNGIFDITSTNWIQVVLYNGLLF